MLPQKTIGKTFVCLFWKESHEEPWSFILSFCTAPPPSVKSASKWLLHGFVMLHVTFYASSKPLQPLPLARAIYQPISIPTHISVCLWTIWCKNWPLLIIFTWHFLHTTKLNNKTSETECPMPRLLPIECHVVLRWGHVDVSSDGGIQWEYVYIYTFIYIYIQYILPRNLTWNLKMMVSKRNFLF